MGVAALPAAIGLQVAGSASSAYSAQQAGLAQEGYYKYVARQADSEANLAEAAGAKTAHSIEDAAAYEFSRMRRGVRQTQGAQAAALAASGNAGTTTAEDIARDTVDKARLDEMVIHYNADSQAGETLRQAGLSAYNLRSQAEGYRMAGSNARAAGDRAFVSTLLGGASSVASTFAMAYRPSTVPPPPSGVSGSISPFGSPRTTSLQIARPY